MPVLESLRKPDGRTFIAVPAEDNSEFDRSIQTGEFAFYELSAVLSDPSHRGRSVASPCLRESPIRLGLALGPCVRRVRLGRSPVKRTPTRRLHHSISPH